MLNIEIKQTLRIEIIELNVLIYSLKSFLKSLKS